VTFLGREHVVPQAFGDFRNAPVLKGCVCDACNTLFSRELDLYLARDTPEGLLRFRFGLMDAAEYKSLGKRSTMRTGPVTGRMAGARTWYEHQDGKLVPFVAPQVGFAKAENDPSTIVNGPFKWYSTENLPTPAEIREIFGTGVPLVVEFAGIGNSEDNTAEIEVVREALKAKGFNIDGPLNISMRRGVQPEVERFEDAATIGPLFFRCIAKICVNYLAFLCGPDPIYGEAFDPIREFILGKNNDARLTHWRPADPPTEPQRRPGDAYFVGFRRIDEGLQGRVRLLSGAHWGKLLTLNDDGIPRRGAGHVYDLDTMTVRPLYPWYY
jgi:hypothetical protein